MSSTILQGTVSFVNYEKKYIMIEYLINNKKKTINGLIAPTQKHKFVIGDTVNFTASLSGRGDKIVANNIVYKYNTALDVIINKAKINNSFIGYLKIASDSYYVKEIGSYLFFPVPLSPWQIKPTENFVNEEVSFSLLNLDKKEKISAKLFNNTYIPEFYTAVKLHKAKTIIEAVIYKITIHGIYLNIIGDKIQSKISKDELNSLLKVGDKIKVLITYLSPFKIIVNEIKLNS